MPAKTRIALAQINTTVGDLTGNSKKILNYIEMAREKGADIVVFPELAICGYPPEDLLLKENFISDNLAALNSIIKESKGISVIIGFVDRDGGGNLYNSAAIIDDGVLKGVYHKTALPNYGVFDEKRYFAPGSESCIYKLRSATIGVTICEDIWINEKVCVEQSLAGAGILINISASPYYTGKTKERISLLRDRAMKTKSFICYNNLVGAQDELVFDGSSFIFDPDGNLIAQGKKFEEDLVISDLSIKKGPVGSKIESDDIEDIYNALVLGTRDYAHKNGFKKAAIGLSGGMDSALTALIAADALGKENVTCVSMPSRYSSVQTKADAAKLASNAGINFLSIPIDSIYDVYLITLSNQFAGKARNAAEENIQARIRATILMALSNKFGWLILATGNKSEASTGYCTLYGDMAGGFSVLKDIFKTLVYKLAEFRNKKESGRLIPESIFKRAPTAELSYNQKDIDTLPPYSVLDSILKSYIEHDDSFEDIIANKKDPATVRKVIDMVDKSEYKRRQAPPGIKITKKAFGKDRRMPITNRYI